MAPPEAPGDLEAVPTSPSIVRPPADAVSKTVDLSHVQVPSETASPLDRLRERAGPAITVALAVVLLGFTGLVLALLIR